jgi:hypothetical protein
MRVASLEQACSAFLAARSGWTAELPDDEFWPYARSVLAGRRLADGLPFNRYNRK